MKAIILAGGKGTRLQPLTLETPKPLLKVAGRPLIERLIRSLPPEVSEIVIVIGYLGDKIKEHCGAEFFGRPITYVQQEHVGGTYAALELCRPLLGDDGGFLLLFPDDLLDAMTIEKCAREPLAVVTAHVADPRAYGVIETDGMGMITKITEKPEHPESNLILTCCYKLTMEIFDHPPEPHPRTSERYVADALGALARTHNIATIVARFWMPITTPEDLAMANEFFGQ